ncbi:hypothetical protein GOP47_0019037 [Adiantum capillus-veneris]|uniref:Replication protein A subunit n=1 Tax=Adiantum capillus-veneris TaxID=13818 RepID=A0A9D4Z8Q2_ADICA|nr:hypothetical protein GOP47_0019037 [Adiantum capillus-veneris]
MVSVTPNCITSILAAPSSDAADYVVQVVDLKNRGNDARKFLFLANDGSSKFPAMVPTEMSEDVISGKLQNLGLLRIKAYILSGSEKSRGIVPIKAEIVAPSLGYEIGASEKDEAVTNVISTSKPPIILQPKMEKNLNNSVVMSAAQIVQELRGNAAPAVRMGISRRVYPLVSLNPYQGNWTIKVRVTDKGPMRSFKNARGDGNVFNVELTDEDGTQIRASMFKEAADKFFPKLELGKVYYISKGSLRVANKQYATVKNDYEMTLHSTSEVEEALDEQTKIPELCYNLVKIEDLGPCVNGKELVDVIGVVQSVTGIVSIRRKLNNEEVPKRDIVIADESKKTVTVSLWSDMASNEGEKLMNMVDESPIVLVKKLRVSDYQGVSLSANSGSILQVNPDIPEAHKLRSWFMSEGKDAQMISAGVNLPGGGTRSGSRSMFSDRKFITDIVQSTVGEGKPEYFNVRGYISFIKPEQAMWYLACQTCNKKVTEDLGSSKFWCEGCQKSYEECNRRYILTVKFADFSAEGWISAFNEQAEVILGHPADKLAEIRSQDGEMKAYSDELKKAVWVPYVLRVSVVQSEYMNEKRQRITVRSISSVNWEEESKYLLEQITKMKSGAS